MPKTSKSRTTLLLESLERRDVPATLYVNSANNDGAPADSFLDFEEATYIVNNSGDSFTPMGRALTAAEMYQIDTSEPFGVNDRIVYTLDQPVLMGGDQFFLRKNVKIQPQEGSRLLINGNNLRQIFEITNNANVTLTDIDMVNARATFRGGAISVTNSTLTMVRCSISGSTLNSPVDFISTTGGAINAQSSRLTVIDSAIYNNTSNRTGGAIGAAYGSDVTIVRSTISGNTAAVRGGAVYMRDDPKPGKITILDSTFVNNTGLGAITPVQLNASHSLKVKIDNSIVVGSSSAFRFDFAHPSFTGSYNLLGTITGAKSNLDSGTNNSIDQTLSTVKLGSLTNNGGPTLTHAILSGSPALDSGNPALNPPDQRGLPTFNGRRDRGAFESQTSFNSPPVLANVPASRSENEASAITFTATTTDPDSTTFAYSLVNAPTGATINATTGAFTWTPTESQDGVFNIGVRVSDGVNTDTDFVVVTVNEVNQAPTLGNLPGTTSVNRGSSLSFLAPSTDADIVQGQPQSRFYSLVNPPSGAHIDSSTGAFSWTIPATQSLGNVTFGVRVTDNGNPAGSATSDLTITVTGNTVPIINVPSNITANEKTLITFTATAVDPDAQTRTFGLVNAPIGSNINTTTGVFTWVPEEEQDGFTSFEVSVTDGVATVTAPVTVQVREVNEAPSLSTGGNQTVERGLTVLFLAGANDGDRIEGREQTLTFSLVNAPAGASIDANTGEFLWPVPLTQPLGDVTFGIRVTDDANPAASTTNNLTFTITGNTEPVLNNVPVYATATEGAALTFTATDVDPDTQTLTFGLVDAPTGATINPTTGLFSWTPTENQDGIFNFTVSVSDGVATATRPVTVTVRETNQAPTLSGVPAARTTVLGAMINFTATATDADLVDGLGNTKTFSLVNAPAGASIDPDTGVFTWTPNEFNPLGTHVFKVRVTDDGVPALSATKTMAVNLVRAGVVDGTLMVGGTGGNDTLSVLPNKQRTLVAAKNGQLTLGTFPVGAFNRIEMYGLAGNDALSVSPLLTQRAFLFGGTGGDKLTGGGGSDVLVGGDDNDSLSGGLGLNVLIGGNGADKMMGGSSADLLIASATVFDHDLTSLMNINAEWKSGGLFSTRVSNLMAGAGLASGVSLTSANINNDQAKDTLTGSNGTDWFITNVADLLSPVPVVGEIVTTV